MSATRGLANPPRHYFVVRDTYPNDSYEYDSYDEALAAVKAWDVAYRPRAPHRVIRVTVTEEDVTHPRCICESYEYGSGAEIPKPNPECRKCFPRHPAPYTEGAPSPVRFDVLEGE